MTPEEPAGIEVGELPTRVAVTPDGRRAFVLNEGSGSVSVVDLAGSTVVATVELPAKPSATRSFTIPKAIAVAPDGRSVYVGGSIEGDLRIIDVATNTLRPGQLGGSALPEPDGVAIHPEGGIGSSPILRCAACACSTSAGTRRSTRGSSSATTRPSPSSWPRAAACST